MKMTEHYLTSVELSKRKCCGDTVPMDILKEKVFNKYMGFCESATASIGIKISLNDLVKQITKKNQKLILEMLNDGFIEDENEFYNEVFEDIVNSLSEETSSLKKILTSEFQTRGTYVKCKFTDNVDESGSLLEQYLLVPVKTLLCTSRWGYNRTGTNGICDEEVDFTAPDLEKYKGLKNFKTVFMLSQNSG
jgi:hypothetical protein